MVTYNYASLFLLLLLLHFVGAKTTWEPSGIEVFTDYFPGYSLDENKWEIKEGNEGFGKNKLQCYKRDNLEVRDSTLTITAKQENVMCDHPPKQFNFTSARIHTRNAYKIKAIEIKARIPNGYYLQPALWTQKSGDGFYEELDIMETKSELVTRLYQTAYWGKDWRGLCKNGKTSSVKNMSEVFHLYGLEVTDTEVKFYFDGQLTHTVERRSHEVEKWKPVGSGCKGYTPAHCDKAFDQPAKLIMNIGIGGNWFSKEPEPKKANWTKPTMEVKYVKIFSNDVSSTTTRILVSIWTRIWDYTFSLLQK